MSLIPGRRAQSSVAMRVARWVQWGAESPHDRGGSLARADAGTKCAGRPEPGDPGRASPSEYFGAIWSSTASAVIRAA